MANLGFLIILLWLVWAFNTNNLFQIEPWALLILALKWQFLWLLLESMHKFKLELLSKNCIFSLAFSLCQKPLDTYLQSHQKMWVVYNLHANQKFCTLFWEDTFKLSMVLYMSSSFWRLGVESRDFLKLRKKELLAKLGKFTKWQLFSV